MTGELERAEENIAEMARKERRARKWDRRFVRLGLVLIVAGGWSLHDTQGDITSESFDRRDQNCLSFERQERTARNELQRSREYLAKPPANAKERALKRQLAPLIRKRSLPQLVEDVKGNRAPAYCNEPGVGLPE